MRVGTSKAVPGRNPVVGFYVIQGVGGVNKSLSLFTERDTRRIDGPWCHAEVVPTDASALQDEAPTMYTRTFNLVCYKFTQFAGSRNGYNVFNPSSCGLKNPQHTQETQRTGLRDWGISVASHHARFAVSPTFSLASNSTRRVVSPYWLCETRRYPRTLSTTSPEQHNQVARN